MAHTKVHRNQKSFSLTSPKPWLPRPQNPSSRDMMQEPAFMTRNHDSPEIVQESIEDPFEDKLEPIAVIGMAFRGPQDATSPDALWSMIRERRSAMTEIPKSRFNVDAFSNVENPRTGLLNVRGGHFMEEDLAAFDAPFFSISSVEATQMDPQQRWLLETTYEALENAGIPAGQATGSRTSVHIGSFTREFETMLQRDPEMRTKYRATGVGMTMLANRLSWYFDFSGPSLAVDTACSSSLTTVHLACQSLRSGEVEMGIAGGCNLILNPDTMTTLTDMGFLSPDNKCHSFDSRANGYSRGEGFGLVVLKRLKDALQNRDTIRGVIRATGVNQDGRTPSITQPSSAAQERLIMETYRDGGLSLSSTRFFEAHGTGTAVGDPLEAQAIHNAFRDPLKDHSIYVGAVKSNVGHLEGASGITGLIKTILALETGVIPPNLWFENPNQHIDPKAWNLEFPTSNIPWPVNGLRRASINSFGYGGSNAHCVIDDTCNYLRLRGLSGNHNTAKYPPNSQKLQQGLSPRSRTNGINGVNGGTNGTHSAHRPCPILLVWSGPDESSLKRLAIAYEQNLKAKASLDYEYERSLAFTLSERRTMYSWKSFMVVPNSEASICVTPDTISKPVRSAKSPRLCFVFTGQGAQWARMGVELEQYRPYSESLRCAEAFFKSLGSSWRLTDEIQRNGQFSLLDQPELSQPVCTALQIALLDLFSDWNLRPSVVVGHSSGEIAAAYATGAISRESAWKIAYYRGNVASWLSNSSQKRQGMLAVALSQAEVTKYLESSAFKTSFLAVACINSPKSVTVAGNSAALDALKAQLDQESVFARRLKVNVAYHTEYMQNASGMYASLLGSIAIPKQSNSSEPIMISSVTGQRIESRELCDPQYWVRNMTSPVKFLDAISIVCTTAGAAPRKLRSRRSNMEVDYFLEIGPHAALRGPIRETFHATRTNGILNYSSSLMRGQSAAISAVKAAGELFCAGAPTLISRVNSISSESNVKTLVDLPKYPFDHSKLYWQESRISKDFRFRDQPYHELLGNRAMDWNPSEARWRNILATNENPWMLDHKVQGSTVYPAAGIVTMAMEAARQLLGPERSIYAYRIKNMTISKALVIPTDPENVEAQLHMQPLQNDAKETSQWADFRLYAYEDTQWSEISRGTVGLDFHCDAERPWETANPDEPLQRMKEQVLEGSKQCSLPRELDSFYDYLRSTGVTYGPLFRCMKDLSVSPTQNAASATVDRSSWKIDKSVVPPQPCIIHPIALDTIFQLLSAAVTKGGSKPSPPMLPTQIQEMWILDTSSVNESHSDATVFATADRQGFRSADLSLTAIDTVTQHPIIMGLVQTSFMPASSNEQDALANQPTKLCYNIEWKPEPDFLTDSDFRGIVGRTEATTVTSSTDLNTMEKLCELMCHRMRGEYEDLEGFADRPHLIRYRQWMNHAIAARQTKTLDLSRPSQIDVNHLIDAVEMQGPGGKLLGRVARALPNILEGSVDALELLFQDSLINDFYAQANNMAQMFSETARYIDLLAHRNPALRVLEIGAGTGSATVWALNILNKDQAQSRHVTRFTEYAYTDISAGFFEMAREKFPESAKRMTFSILDINEDPVQQGFQADHYDLIIASNVALRPCQWSTHVLAANCLKVIHATRNLDRTLRNTRKLLKPGGNFILYELTRSDLLTPGFIFGLLPGWWAASEESRQSSPLITEDEWHKRLRHSGFSGVDQKLRNSDNLESHLASALISKTVSIKDADVQERAVSIVIHDTSSTQFELAQAVQSKLSALGLSNSEILSLSECEQNVNQGLCAITLLDLERSSLLDMNESEFRSLQHLVSISEILIWPTCQDFYPEANANGTPPGGSSTIDGFLRAVRLEHDQLKAILVSLEVRSSTDNKIGAILHVLQKALKDASKNPEVEYEERQGILGIRRLVEDRSIDEYIDRALLPPQPQPSKLGDGVSRPLKLSIGTPGLLSSFHFEDDLQAKTPIGADEIEIKVVCSGLNFRDLLVSLGRLNENFFGLECSGVVTQSGDHSRFRPGDRVTCLTSGAIRSYARCKMLTAVHIPSSVDFRSAAALPIVYCTAYYALVHSARLRAQESILIHSAAGGLGQALVQLALMLGAKIYATVGSKAKKEFLIQKYGLHPDHIFSSRSLAFLQKVRLATDRRGFDVVVNSLSGERLKSSWECVAPFGRFVEVGKKDIESFQSLPMTKFSINTSFASVDLLYMKDNKPALAGELLQTVITLFQEGKIQIPTAFRVYDASHLEEAFRAMQSGDAMGKAVFEFSPTDTAQIIPDSVQTCDLDPQASYIIAGGLGGLGRSAARWMVRRGARHLLLLSRTKPSDYNSTIQAFIRDLEVGGVDLRTASCDVSKMDDLRKTLAIYSETMPPLKGCLQASMVLRDGSFRSLTLSNFQAAIGPKVYGSWNLHTLLPCDLDFFVMLSSATGLLGNYGQSNYGGGNTYQDALAHYRNSIGQKAVSLDLGVMNSVGYVAEQIQGTNSTNEFVASSTGVTEEQFHAVLDYSCRRSDSHESSQDVQIGVGIETPAAHRARGVDDPFWLRKPVAFYLHQMDFEHGPGADVVSSAVDYAATLGTVQSIGDAATIVYEALTQKLSRFIAIEPVNIEREMPLHAYGIDSLSAIELRKWFSKVLKADVTVFEILGNATIASVAGIVARKSELVPNEIRVTD